MVRTPGFHCRGLGSILGWGTKIPQVAQNNQENQNQKKNPKFPSANEQIKMWYIYSMEYYLTIKKKRKKNEIKPFAVT